MKYIYLLLILLLIIPIAYSEKVMTDKGTYILVKEDQKEVNTKIQDEIDSLYQTQIDASLEKPANPATDTSTFYIALVAFLLVIIVMVVFVLRNFSGKKNSKNPKRQKKLSRREKKASTKRQLDAIKESADMLKKYGIGKETAPQSTTKPAPQADVLKKYDLYNKSTSNAEEQVDVLKKYNLYNTEAAANTNIGQIDILKKYNLHNKSESNQTLTERTNNLGHASREISRDIQEEREEFESSKFTVRDLRMRKIIIASLEDGENTETITLILKERGYKRSEIKRHIKHIIRTLELKERLSEVSKKLDDFHYEIL